MTNRRQGAAPATTSTEPEVGVLRPDEPIRGPVEDKLLRGALVECIARHILAASARASVVIALNAPWGAGKSSFLNLLADKLAARVALDGQPPIVVRFNPWHYTNVEQLVRVFFDELAVGIGTARQRRLGKKIGKLLGAAGSLAAVYSSGAGELLKGAGSVLQREKGLDELRGELNQLLPGLGQPVVVFVDDLDRLERDTLRLMFRVIRLNADFPNVTYVLAFDRLVVEANLDEPNGIRGRDYIEKIVQVAFDIPQPEPSTLHSILFSELDAVVGSLPLRALDQHRWGNVFNSGFKEHFRTIRHIKRYANGLRLTLPPVAREVDPADFFAVELLRTFHPEVYSSVAHGKEFLASTAMGTAYQVPTARLREWIESVCTKAGPLFVASIRELLCELFPELARVYGNMTYGSGFLAEWRREARVCSPEVFDKYFLLAVPRGDVSVVELEGFVAALSDPDAARSLLLSAKEAGKGRRFLERLEDYTKDLPVGHVPPLVRLLFEEGDVLRFEQRGMFDIFAEMQVERLEYQLFSRMPTPGRENLLEECFRTGKGLYTLAQVLWFFQPTDRRERIVDEEVWAKLRDVVVERLSTAASSGELWTIRKLPTVLSLWKQWATPSEVGGVLERRAVDDANFLDLIAAFTDVARSYTVRDKVERRRTRLSRAALGEFLRPEDVESRLRGVAQRGGEQGDLAGELLALLEADVGV